MSVKAHCMTKRMAQSAAPKRRKPNRGWFKKGNTAALTTAVHTDRVPAGLEQLHAEVERFMAGALADEGGEADIPTRRRNLLDLRGHVVYRNILKLAHALDTKGLVDRRGKLRVAWLQQLGALIDRAVRIDAMLGLDRKAKRIEGPLEWLERRTRETQPPAEPVDDGGEV